jgi:hypothetical protein
MLFEDLQSAYEPGMSADDLFDAYAHFGEDPWIDGPGDVQFSAWSYAKLLAAVMTGGRDMLP